MRSLPSRKQHIHHRNTGSRRNEAIECGLFIYGESYRKNIFFFSSQIRVLKTIKRQSYFCLYSFILKDLMVNLITNTKSELQNDIIIKDINLQTIKNY